MFGRLENITLLCITMENQKEITLTETQLIMLSAMCRKFNFNDFIEKNDWIEDEGSISWFDEQFDEMAAIIIDWGDYYENQRKKDLEKSI